jgi:hypothetical protein
LLRTLVDHFAAFGGIPLLAVFDRPKTVALHWAKDGTITEWNSTFAAVALDLGLGVEVCWPHRGNQKGASKTASSTASSSVAATSSWTGPRCGRGIWGLTIPLLRAHQLLNRPEFPESDRRNFRNPHMARSGLR